MNTLDIFAEKGTEIGLEEGLAKGRREKTEKAVRNTIIEGLPIELISKI